MTDIVERLRDVFPIGWEGEMRHEAADEIERLRSERHRLAGEVSRAHKDALAWMEKAAAARATLDAASDEIDRLLKARDAALNERDTARCWRTGR